MAANNFTFTYPPAAAAAAAPAVPQPPPPQQSQAYAQPPPPQPAQPQATYTAYNVAYTTPYAHPQQPQQQPQPAQTATYAATYTAYPAAAPAAAAPAAQTYYAQAQPPVSYAAYAAPAAAAPRPTYSAPPGATTYTTYAQTATPYTTTTYQAAPTAQVTAKPATQQVATPIYITQQPSNLTQVPTGPHISSKPPPVAAQHATWTRAAKPQPQLQYAAPAAMCPPPPQPQQQQPQPPPPPPPIQHIQITQQHHHPTHHLHHQQQHAQPQQHHPQHQQQVQQQQPPQPQAHHHPQQQPPQPPPQQQQQHSRPNYSHSGGGRQRSAPKTQQLHYCEVCKISCAGPQTYKEHLDGQKHKKKEAAARGMGNTGPTMRSGNALRCELCDVTCTGSDAYAAHIRGAKHQKVVKLHTKLGKPIPSVDPVVVSGGKPSEGSSEVEKKPAAPIAPLSVVTSVSTAAQIHLQGSPIQTVVQKAPQPYTLQQQQQHQHAQQQQQLHHQQQQLQLAAQQQLQSAAAVAASSKASVPKINFIAASKKFDDANTAVNAASKALTSPSEVTIPRLPDEKEVQPVGHDYIEECKNDEGKIVSFNCRLCECRFNDPNAKEMHMKGRRHRLQYKKKVNPDLVVDIKPSLRQRKMAEERAKRVQAREEFWRRREEEFKLMEEEERTYWSERKGRFEEGENGGHGTADFYATRGRRGGRGGGPQGAMFEGGFPPMLRRPDTIDDRHIMFKHSEIYPDEDALEKIQRAVSLTEKALKNVSDIMVEEDGAQLEEEHILLPDDEDEDDEDSGGQQRKKMKKDDSTPTLGSEDIPVVPVLKTRILKGVMKVGVLAKGLLLKNDTDVRLVVLCGEKPTVGMLATIVEHLPEQLKVVAPNDKFTVKEDIEQGCFTVVKETSGVDGFGPVTVTVSLTSPLIRESDILMEDTPEEDDGERKNKKVKTEYDPKKPLPAAMCLAALASVRHAKWFQARAVGRQSCVIITRILRDFALRIPVWKHISLFAIELLVEKVLFSAGLPMSPGDALRRVFEALAGGILLGENPGFLDPCEKEPTDAAGGLTPQQREDVTVSAQNALRLIAFRQVHRVLGVDALPPPKFGRNARFTRKRRRDDDGEGDGDGEGEEDGAVHEKKDKKEEEEDAREEQEDKEVAFPSEVKVEKEKAIKEEES